MLPCDSYLFAYYITSIVFIDDTDIRSEFNSAFRRDAEVVNERSCK